MDIRPYVLDLTFFLLFFNGGTRFPDSTESYTDK